MKTTIGSNALRLAAAAFCTSIAACASDSDARSGEFIRQKIEPLVGKPYSGTDISRRSGATVTVLQDDADKREIEFKWRNGCALALLVDRSTDIIRSWRYTGPSEPCLKIRLYTFGT
jgi:hypothetical protein